MSDLNDSNVKFDLRVRRRYDVEKLDDHNWNMRRRSWYYWHAEHDRVVMLKKCRINQPQEYKFWRDNYRYCVLKLANNRVVMPLPG